MKNKQDNKVSDLVFVEKVLQGDNNAFDFLVKRYFRQMVRVSYRITGNLADAEDAVQQSFLKSYSNLYKFKKKSSFSTWLYRITCNTSLNILKKKQRERKNISEVLTTKQVSVLNKLEISADIKSLREAIRNLPEKQRLTLILRTYENLKFREISEILHCSEGTAKANYFHAVTKLREMLVSEQ